MELQLVADQRQVMSRRMIQSTEILQMNTQELEEYLKLQELENPLIELELPMEEEAGSKALEKLEWLHSVDESNRSHYQAELDERDQQEPWSYLTMEENSLEAYLLSQLFPFARSPEEENILYYLVHSLDSRGYLEETADSLAERFHLTLEEAEEYISWLQSADPAGVGARSVQECLLLQLDRMQDDVSIAREIILHYLDPLERNQLPFIAQNLHISLKTLKDAIISLRSLQPKPRNGFSSNEQMSYLKPDVTILGNGDSFSVVVNDTYLPKIHINSYYSNMLSEDTSKDTKEYIHTKLNQAEWIIQCMEQRQKTLQAVTTQLLSMQLPFFEQGPGNRQPVRLQDIANALNIHESTVSRALKNKYLQCSYGLFPMSYFLSRSVATANHDATTPEQIKSTIGRLIEEENKEKPLSDQAIANLLAATGTKISRRTVAKYRQELNIPGTARRRIYSE